MTLELKQVTRDINFNLSEEQLQILVRSAKDFCIANGLVYQRNDSIEQINVMLTPLPFPRHLFAALERLQPHLNVLIHKVSRDCAFLRDSLQSTIAADPFTARLFDLYEKAEGESGPSQPVSLGVFRSDYFVDSSSGSSEAEIVQVEFNTVALGSLSLATRVPKLHKYILGLISQHDIKEKVAESPTVLAAVDGLLEAWRLYGSESAVLMFIVKTEEPSTPDQRILEYALLERNPYVRVIRRNLGQIHEQGVLKGDKALFVDGHEVAVAYFRAGYHPDQFPTENEWSARLTMELSRAIKCPTLAHHLMGTKKMQQVLASPGVLERFLEDSDLVKEIRQTFTGLYALDAGPEGDRNVEMCLSRPEDFVLKPQREGGGNNVFGEGIRKTLKEDPDSRSQYILMNRIRPKAFKGFMVRSKDKQARPQTVVRELGFMSVFISRGEEVLYNKEAGYLSRSKGEESPEGGVCAGFGAIDSVYLV